MKRTIMTMALVAATNMALYAKTLVVYYSYTNNVHNIVTALCGQIDADVIRIEPAEKGLDYAANNYAIGSEQIAAIRNKPDDAAAYPAIDPVTVNPDEYDTVIIGAPLWWSDMASPLQTFLFHYGKQLAGKRIGLIVSSASSGISGVEADARRLVPGGVFLSPSLWIRSSQTSSAPTLVAEWLKTIDYKNITDNNMNNKLSISANGHTLTATLDDNSSARALQEMLASAGPVTIHMSDYGDMEKVGILPQSLPTNDEHINTVAGDLILYQGRNFVIYYDSNSWNFTRLGKIDNVTSGNELKNILGSGDVDVTLTLSGTAGISSTTADSGKATTMYDLRGMHTAHRSNGPEGMPKGVYIVNGKKTTGR
ncbi:cyclophilin-like fold protein [Xylanibacter rodentium]|nr:cyclophilin-like fold protein [Xylanibacter rodentium]